MENEYINLGLHTEVSLCQATQCSDLCERKCGGFIYLNESCGGCAERHCCEESTACANDVSCLRYHHCWSNCIPGDWGCYEDCASELGTDENIARAEYRDCIANKCYESCEIGQMWSCVDKVIELETADPARKINVTVRFYDIKVQGIEGVTISMCSVGDPICSKPMETAQTDSDGWATLAYYPDESTNFVHFYISKAGRVPARLVFSRPLTGSPDTSSLFLPTPEELASLAGHLGIIVEPGRGHAFIRMLDCAAYSARELVLSAPEVEGSKTFYVKDYIPDLSAQHTSVLGEAVIANLPAKPVIIEARQFKDSDKEDAVIRESILIYPESVTYALVWPK